jgi:hypothetical protein
MLPPARRRFMGRVRSHDERRRDWACISHNRRRVAAHYFGPIDPRRTAVGNAAIDTAPRCDRLFGCFGSLAGPHYAPYMARIFRFPERRSEIAKLRAEIAEIKRTSKQDRG